MKKTFVILIIALLILSVVFFIPTQSSTIKTPFGEMKIDINLVYQDGTSKTLSIAGNMYTMMNPMTIFHNGAALEYIEYNVYVKALGTFSNCEIDYSESEVGFALYERDTGSYPNNPPLLIRTESGINQGNSGYLFIPLNNGESGWFQMYNYHVEETDAFVNVYTDAVDYKLTLFMKGTIYYRGHGDGITGDWEERSGVPIVSNDVYISVTPDGEPPPPSMLTVLSGPETDNTVTIVGYSSQTSVDGIATFTLDDGQYSMIISHEGYDSYQNNDVYVDGPTTIGPYSLSGDTGQDYVITVLSYPSADYIDCEGVNNNYFMSDCDDIGMGIFLVPEPGSYLCTAGWDNLDPHERSKYAYPSESIPSVSVFIYWALATVVSQYYSMEYMDMGSNYEYGGYYLGSK